jgi:hypothetical protein
LSISVPEGVEKGSTEAQQTKREVWQAQSQWFALALSGSILGITLGLTMFWPASAPFFAAPEPLSAATSTAGYESPQRCRECHEEIYQAWSHTSHANALFDPIVRTYMQTIEQPGECFACHTTGYNTASGQFMLAGVTCEACHGPYRPQHPEESMAITTSPDFCGSCHTTTRAEWETSRHGQNGVICLDCHEVHTQRTRADAAEHTLCALCHQTDTQDSIHQEHMEADLRCIECHLDRPDDIPVSGQMATGHSFAATLDNCDECHPDK